RRRVARAREKPRREGPRGHAAPRDTRGSVHARDQERRHLVRGEGWSGMRARRIWAIALNTFREAARIRVLRGIPVLGLRASRFAIVLGEMSIRDAVRVARDVGLASISLFGSLTAIFLGVFLLYTEVQRRTIHAIVSKPIERWEFVIGKYFGMACVL